MNVDKLQEMLIDACFDNHASKPVVVVVDGVTCEITGLNISKEKAELVFTSSAIPPTQPAMRQAMPLVRPPSKPT